MMNALKYHLAVALCCLSLSLRAQAPWKSYPQSLFSELKGEPSLVKTTADLAGDYEFSGRYLYQATDGSWEAVAPDDLYTSLMQFDGIDQCTFWYQVKGQPDVYMPERYFSYQLEGADLHFTDESPRGMAPPSFSVFKHGNCLVTHPLEGRLSWIEVYCQAP